jgi:hypothetical protein
LADVGQSEKQAGLGRRTLTDDIVEGILLSPKHYATVEKAVWEIRPNMVFVKPTKLCSRCKIFGGSLEERSNMTKHTELRIPDVADAAAHATLRISRRFSARLRFSSHSIHHGPLYSNVL